MWVLFIREGIEVYKGVVRGLRLYRFLGVELGFELYL